MNIKTLHWDAADNLRTEQDIVAYLEAAYEEGDSRLIAAALGDVARSRSVIRIQIEASRIDERSTGVFRFEVPDDPEQER